jgi:hypothetical protein
MRKTAGNILKSSDVKLGGQFHLNVDRAASVSRQDKSTSSGTPQAHVVENHGEFGVLEITCSCGAKSYVRCEYAKGRPPDRQPEQTDPVGENENASS